MSLPKIPEIIFVVTRPNPNDSLPEREEFNSWYDLYEWAKGCEVGDTLYKWFHEFGRERCPQLCDGCFDDYCFDYIEDAIEENGWKFFRIPVGDTSQETVRGI